MLQAGCWGLTAAATLLAAFFQVHEDKIAASATCQNQACDRVALKIINFSSYNQVNIADGYRHVILLGLAGQGLDSFCRDSPVQRVMHDLGREWRLGWGTVGGARFLLR